jgi:hypothetical protein
LQNLTPNITEKKILPITTNTLLKIVRLVVWVAAIICLTVVFKVGFNKKNFLKAFVSSENLVDSKNVDSVLLNSGELIFSDKTSFVVDAFRFQGNYEQLPEKLDVNKDREKLYNYIYQRKNNQSIKPKAAKDEDFSIRAISTP